MVKIISRDELKKMMDGREDFVIIDSRTHGGYEKEHLPGAIGIPADRLGESMVRQFGRNRTVVTYCSGWAPESSTIAARKLEKFGFTNVFDFKGGLEDWKKARYPVEKT